MLSVRCTNNFQPVCPHCFHLHASRVQKINMFLGDMHISHQDIASEISAEKVWHLLQHSLRFLKSICSELQGQQNMQGISVSLFRACCTDHIGLFMSSCPTKVCFHLIDAAHLIEMLISRSTS